MDAYEDWARKNPTAFSTLYRSLIPHEQHHSGGDRMPTEIVYFHYKDREDAGQAET